jgi:hypothetical protein
MVLIFLGNTKKTPRHVQHLLGNSLKNEKTMKQQNAKTFENVLKNKNIHQKCTKMCRLLDFRLKTVFHIFWRFPKNSQNMCKHIVEIQDKLAPTTKISKKCQKTVQNYCI